VLEQLSTSARSETQISAYGINVKARPLPSFGVSPGPGSSGPQVVEAAIAGGGSPPPAQVLGEDDEH
jgi:hypothetical protein